jgi:hypothetical protein
MSITISKITYSSVFYGGGKKDPPESDWFSYLVKHDLRMVDWLDYVQNSYGHDSNQDAFFVPDEEQLKADFDNVFKAKHQENASTPEGRDRQGEYEKEMHYIMALLMFGRLNGFECDYSWQY